MKKILVFLLLLSLNAFTQQSPAKNDVIVKLNGEELAGKVLKISDDVIEFSYAGETLTYTIKTSDILKITFASGRVQTFNKQTQSPEPKPTLAATTSVSPGNHKNKVAILPIAFVRDGQAADDAVSEQVQNETFTFMTKHAGVYTIISPRTTNAMLIKAGINRENIKGYTMDDICNILGVEYVVDGLVTMNRTTQTTYQSNTTSTTSKDNDKKDDRNKTENTSSYGTSTQNYQTKLSLAIYNDKGVSVYSQDRTSFWNTQDAYKSTLEYLLKRSPLYTK